MGEANRTVIGFLVLIVLAAAFWFVALAPKRHQADQLGSRVEQMRSEVAAAEGQAAAAAEAKREFSRDYQQLVLLGKAVPAGDDTPSLLIQLNRISARSGVQFRKIELDSTSAVASAPAAPTTPAPTAPATPSSGDSTSSATPVSSNLPATEAAAATLPIGATVGTAGLAIMPYKLDFTGGFFGVAKFIRGLDGLVRTRTGNVAVDGRLVTIDGFSMVPEEGAGTRVLDVSVSVTTYLTPPGQGITDGATAAAPTAATLTSSTPNSGAP